MRGSVLVAAAAVAALALGCDAPPPSEGAGPPSPADAAAAVREILAGDDLLERSARLGALLSALEPEELETVREAFESVRLGRGEVDLVLFATWWARFDPESAYEWSRANWKAEHPRVQVEVFRAWGRSDPEAALRRASRHPVPDVRGAFVGAALDGWAASGRPGFVGYVEGLPRGKEQQRAIGVLAERRVLDLGPEGAFRWAEGLPSANDDFKLHVYRRVASAVAEIDPARAAAWAEGRLDGPLGRGLPRRVATRWVRRDPEAALRWLGTLPAGDNRDDGLEEAYRDWLVQDREAARQWMRRAEHEPWLEPALSIFALSISTEDPAEAMEFAGRIQDEARRHYTTIVIARHWLKSDREAAEAWIASSELPEEVRKRIYAFPDARPGRFPRRERSAEES